MLFEQIQSNKRKTGLIVVLFLLLTLLVGGSATLYMFGDFVSGVIFSAVIMVIYIPIALLRGNKIVLKMNRAKKIEHSQQAPNLWNTVEGLSIAARIPMPELYIIEEGSPNAFATGFSPEKSAIAVTTALLKKLNKEEIEAVMAHEIAHIRNYDIRLTTISLALISIIAWISDIGTRLFLSNSSNRNAVTTIIGLVIMLLAPLLSMLMFFALSRNREFLADASGAELCRNPLALASALQKISADPDPVDNIPPSAAGLYFSEPTKKRKQNWFSTHPLAEERIERLKKM